MSSPELRSLQEKLGETQLVRYVRYVSESGNAPIPKDPLTLKNRLKSLGFEPQNFIYSGPGRKGYAIDVQGQDVSAYLYPHVALVDINLRPEMVAQNGDLRLVESDSNLLNLIDEEYERSPDQNDAKIPIRVSQLTRKNPWDILVIQEFQRIISERKYWTE